jgi:hypothetical protein
MKRREALRTTAVVAATAGIAGCSGILGGGCGKPSGDLEDALPSGGDYEQQGDVNTDSNSENVVNAASTNYEGQDDEMLFAGVSEFEDADTASEEADDAENSGEGEFGYVIVDEFVYFGWGPDEDSVRGLLAGFEPLNEGCVENNVEWV